jgi:histone H3/H4
VLTTLALAIGSRRERKEMADDFSKEILRHAAARACLALDYKQAHASVLDCLADIVVHYIESLGERIHDNAEMAGRAVPGIHDCISSLDAVVHHLRLLLFAHFLFLVESYNENFIPRAECLCLWWER